MTTASAARLRWLVPLVVAVLALAAAAAWFGLQERSASDSTAQPGDAARSASNAEFIGSDACAKCHADEFAAWQASQHRQAMMLPDERSMLGNFADGKFDYAGVTTTFSLRDGKYIVRTDGPDGQLADYPVKYTFGVYPLQQYLLELPRGHVQALSVAWDARPQDGQRWFHLYPDERVDHRDELHWTRRAQNWNYMCADCHSTNVQKNYDPATDAFSTTYSEISVGCEACHGPGSAHARWAEQPDADPTKGLTVALDERRNVSWSRDATTQQPRRSQPRTSQREIETCAPCHARRTQIAEGYRAGAPFLDHYLPALPVAPLYHSDGQQREEVFIWASWLQSKMHGAGVTCSDCHDPHTQKLRAPGNTVCAQCHDASKYDATAHHHHPLGQPAAQCVSCHMPTETYMVLDPRRDHSMRVPRPDLTVSLGVPNACSGCHRENTAQWAADAVRRWYGRDASGFQQFAATFAAAERADPRVASDLVALAFAPAQAPVVRAAAIELMGRQDGRDATDVATQAARDAEPLVRLAATRLGEVLPADRRATALAPLLADPLRAIRIEAARVLAIAQSGLPEASRANWNKAAAEYVATLKYNADRPESSVALGTFEAALGRLEPARAAFAQAVRLDPQFVPAYVNEADVLRAAGQEAEAVAALQRGLAQAPDSAAIHHALGLAQVRQQQVDAALRSLERATELDPADARYAYVYAVALHSTGNTNKAIRALQDGVGRWPNDRDMLLGLASFQLQAGDGGGARGTVARLLQAYPGDPDGKALEAQAAVIP